MTTIVVKDNIMAADTLGLFEGVRIKMQKIFRIHGMLFGVCGNYDNAIEFIRRYRKDKNFLTDYTYEANGPDKNDFDYLLLNKSGLYLTTGYGPQIKLQERQFAIGSGKEAALGALYMGASAGESVKIAHRIDCHTGPMVSIKELGKEI